MESLPLMDLSNVKAGDYLIVYSSVTCEHNHWQISLVSDKVVYLQRHDGLEVLILDKISGIDLGVTHMATGIFTPHVSKNTNPCGWKIYQPDTNA